VQCRILQTRLAAREQEVSDMCAQLDKSNTQLEHIKEKVQAFTGPIPYAPCFMSALFMCRKDSSYIVETLVAPDAHRANSSRVCCYTR
jgi:hypothetical protein